MKGHFTLFALVAVCGAVSIVNGFWINSWHYPQSHPLFAMALLLGVAFLTVGVLGIAIEHFKPESKLRKLKGAYFTGFLVLVVISTISVASVAVFVEALTYNPLIPGRPPSCFERVNVSQVSLEDAYPSTLLVNVEWVGAFKPDDNIVFTDAIIKTNTAALVTIVKFDPYIILPAFTEKELTINLDSNLTSGTYTATLVSTAGNAFVSPSFTVP